MWQHWLTLGWTWLSIGIPDLQQNGCWRDLYLYLFQPISVWCDDKVQTSAVTTVHAHTVLAILVCRTRAHVPIQPYSKAPGYRGHPDQSGVREGRSLPGKRCKLNPHRKVPMMECHPSQPQGNPSKLPIGALGVLQEREPPTCQRREWQTEVENPNGRKLAYGEKKGSVNAPHHRHTLGGHLKLIHLGPVLT